MNRHDWYLFYLLTVYLFGCILFLMGFFPVDFREGHINRSPEPPTTINGTSLKRPVKHTSKVVFMLVDALRYDFVTKKHMPFSNQQCKMKLKATIPTVTLPRIKSLTTGTISKFIDVVLNLGSSQPLQDSILHKLHAREDRIVFYGDSTWVELFGHLFQTYRTNTDSFYLQEFYAADNDITKSMRHDLKDISKWDFMILHYIGLDRIGHVEGSAGEKIHLKLREMDDVVQEIDNVLSGQNSQSKPLVLVTADHGMRNGGGHGGSSSEEIYVPLIVTGQNCSQRGVAPKYNQVDIAPTLAILLDVPIPSTSIGCLIPELLETMTDEDKLYALYYNTKFLIDKANTKFEDIESEDYYAWYVAATQDHKHYLTTLTEENSTSGYLFKQSKLNYIRSAQYISDLFARSYTNVDFETIVMGVTLTSSIFILILMTCINTNNTLPRRSHRLFNYLPIVILASVINTFLHGFNILESKYFCLVVLKTVVIFTIIIVLMKIFKTLTSSRIQLTVDIPLSIAFGVIFQTFSLVSTSFIEEEHQTWYFLGPTFILSIIWRNVSKTRLKVITLTSSSMERDMLLFISVLRPLRRAFIAMGITVFVRRLNQTGDKWLRVPDVGDWFALPDNKIYLSIFLAFSLLLLIHQLRTLNTPLQTVACIIACVAIYCYRGGFTGAVVFFHTEHFNPFLVLPFFWTSLIYILASSYLPVICRMTDKVQGNNTLLCNLLATNLTVFALVSALLHKPHNVFLVFAMHFILRCGYSLCETLKGPRKTVPAQIVLIYKVALTVCVSKMFYFYQGNSNSLAAIDLNPGFIGLTLYSPIFVGLMVTANTYFAEIFGFLHLLLNIYQKQAEISITKETNEFENYLSEKNNYNLVTTLLATIKLSTTSVYLILMILFRHHLFIFTVFSPKVLYECYSILLFYVNFLMTNLYFSVLYKYF